MANIARSYTEAEVGKLLIESDGRPRPSKAYANPSASDEGHALSKHSLGGTGRNQPSITVDGLLARAEGNASAYPHGAIVRATTLVLNSAAGLAALRTIQQLGSAAKSAEICYCFNAPVVSQQVEPMRMPSGQIAKGMVYGHAELGYLLIEPNGETIFIVTSYPDTRAGAPAQEGLIAGRGRYDVVHYYRDSFGVGHITGVESDG